MIKPEIQDDNSVSFTREDGARFFVSLDGDDLWIHAQAPDGMSGPVEFEPNAGNEGWIKLHLRPGIKPQPIRRRKDHADA